MPPPPLSPSQGPYAVVAGASDAHEIALEEGEASEAPPPAGHLTQTKTVVVSNCISCDIEPKEECWSGKR